MKYRAEIDGLRAIAVIPVILFHAGIDLFSGGFIGVDVFFVISGYLITTILISEIEDKQFSIFNFYERRARRILPALYTMMIVCIPFAWMWMLPNQMKDFAEGIIAVSLFGSNILFWRSSGYFEASSEENPLLHTWSLAVEEQYYLLFPLFLIISLRFGKKQSFWVICLLAAFSLALTEWGWRNQATANFYLAPTRAWELLAGSLCAFILLNRGVQANNKLSFLGLVLIIGSIFVFDQNTPFPSLYAILPVLGSVFLILFAEKNTLSGKLLSTKPLVSIGLVSYSAYLWHQPLLVFSRMRFGHSTFVLCTVGLLLVVLTFLTWRYIEQPFRNKKIYTRTSILVAAFSLFIGTIMFGIVGSTTNIFKSQFESDLAPELRNLVSIPNFVRDESPEFVSGWRYGTCFYDSKFNSFDAFDKEICLTLDPKKKNILLLGDSHAAQWNYGITEEYEDINVMLAASSGCLPLLDASGAKRCTDLMNFIFTEYLPNEKLDAIVLAARWDDQETRESLVDTLKFIRRFNDNVIVFGPTAEYGIALPSILLRSSLTENKIVVDRDAINSYQEYEKFSLSRQIEKLVVSTESQYISITDALCPNKQCMVLTNTGEIMAFDYGHLTLEGSQFVISKLKKNGLLSF